MGDDSDSAVPTEKAVKTYGDNNFYLITNNTKANHDSLALDHGALSGKDDDDHTQYIKVDGTRAFTGDQSVGTHKITTDEYWHEVDTTGEPGFENNWDNVGGDYNTCAFRFDAEGKVWIKGIVIGGLANTPIFHLPVEYRSSKTQFFAVATAPNYGQMSIDTDGAVKLVV